MVGRCVDRNGSQIVEQSSGRPARSCPNNIAINLIGSRTRNARPATFMQIHLAIYLRIRGLMSQKDSSLLLIHNYTVEDACRLLTYRAVELHIDG